LLVVASLAVAGCATVPKQAYNRAANKDVHVVGVLEPATSDDYFVQNVGHVGLSFGLIGGLIAMADMNGKTSEFTKAAKASGLALASEYQTELVREVEKAGYVVKILQIQRPKSAFLSAYDGLDDLCDVYLDSTIYAGYMSASGITDYVPAVRAAIRVVKRSTKDVLYQEYVAYGYEFRGAQAISISSDPKYRFKDHPTLMANMPLAVEGLRNGIPAVVGQISRDLAP